MAHEATLCKELELKYASICSVDNYAHGISNTAVSEEMLLENTKKNFSNLHKVVDKVLESINVN